MMAQWLVHLLHKQKVGVQIPLVALAFLSNKYFYLPFPTSVEKVIEQDRINPVMPRPPN